MSHRKQPVDEYTLAAFLSGTLPEERRREVVAYLAENADARTLLCMAHEAMEAARQPVAEPFEMPPPTPQPAASEPAPSVPQTLRPAAARGARRRQRLRRVATGALMMVVLAIGLRLGLSLNDTDALRGDPAEDDRLRVRVSTPALQFQWTAVAEAYYYRLVVWDVEAAELVARHETKSTRLGRNDAFVLSLHPQLKIGRLYSARIDALDVQNRLIQQSDLVEFILRE